MSDVDRPTSGGSPVILVMLLALMGATAGILFLMVDSANRTEKFWLTLGTLLLAEGLLFVRGFLCSWSANPHRASSEGDSGITLVMWVYLLAVLVLALVAIAPIGFKWLAMLHILAFLGLALGWGSMSLGKGFLQRMEAKPSTSTGSNVSPSSPSDAAKRL